MDQRISLITLGVDDVALARTFYERLGWHGQEVDETVFFQAGGMAIVLWDRGKLAGDSGVADSGRSTFDGVVLALNVRSEEEVRQIVTAAADIGAVVTRPPAETFYGGFAGVFRRSRWPRLGDRLQPRFPSQRRWFASPCPTSARSETTDGPDPRVSGAGRVRSDGAPDASVRRSAGPAIHRTDRRPVGPAPATAAPAR